MRGADFLFLFAAIAQIVRNAAVGQNARQAFAVRQKGGGCAFDIVARAKILVVQQGRAIAVFFLLFIQSGRRNVAQAEIFPCDKRVVGAPNFARFVQQFLILACVLRGRIQKGVDGDIVEREQFLREFGALGAVVRVGKNGNFFGTIAPNFGNGVLKI